MTYVFLPIIYRRPVKYKDPTPMKTDNNPDPTTAVFLQNVSVALTQLKQQLQKNYEQAYPDLREIIHLVLDEEETNAWSLSSFPHLLLPDLVEAHIEKLNLQPAAHDHLLLSHGFANLDPSSLGYGVPGNCQPVLAPCG